MSKECSPKVVPLKLSHWMEVLCRIRKVCLAGINLLHCGSKKGIAIPHIRAHSEFTAIKKTR
jgi:hypothetical protein